MNKVTPYLFVLPFFVVFLTFNVFPYVYGLRLAFSDTGAFSVGAFVGLRNFTDIFRDIYFRKALANTLIYVVLSLVIHVPIAFLMAVVLNSKLIVRPRVRAVFRSAFFVPFLLSAAVVGVMFRVLFISEFGAINWLLSLVGVPGRDWLNNAGLTMTVLMVVATWMYVGYHMVFFLAALQAIDPQLYESAEIDGATPIRRVFSITVPLMLPAIAFVVIRVTIGALQIFELPYMLYNAQFGPDRSAFFLMSYIYQYGFQYGLRGYASAAGWVTFVIILAISIAQIRALNRGMSDLV